MLENQMMLLAVFERAALMLMTLFLLTRTRPVQRLFQKRDHTPAGMPTQGPNRMPPEMMAMIRTLMRAPSTGMPV